MPDASEGQPPSEGAELFRLLADSLTDYAVIVTDAERRVRTWTPGAERLLGYTAAEMVGEPVDRIFTPEDVAAGVPGAEAREALATGRASDDRWHLRKDGSRFWASGVLTALREPDGTFRGFAKVLRDLTAQKRAEEALREERDFADALVNGLPGVFYLIGDDRQFDRWNRNLEVVSGYSADEVARMGPTEFFAEEDRPLIAERVREAFEHGHATAEVPLLTRDGRRIPHFFTGVRVALDGRPYVTGLGVDISDRVRAEEALKEADRQKDLFLATLAHELRNQLAPIRNGLQVIRLAEDRATRDHARSVAERQLANLVRLVDDLMDVSRIGRGKVLLRSERTDLARVVAEAAEAARPLMDARGHRFSAAVPPGPVAVDGDPGRLGQVVANLLANAAKYTPDGGSVAVALAREGGAAVVRVSDTGVGIAPEVLPRVFEAFAQADQTRDRSEGGLGIGLALVRGLVELHGGTVAAESPGRGSGSTFTVRLPALPEGAGTPPDSAPEPAATAVARRVLVVDDNEDAADSLGLLLEMLGHEARVAHDGAAALAAAEQWRPDVVLLDLGMPGMDGYEVAARLRSRADLVGVQLVALTGWAADNERCKTREAGFDHHLVKPVDAAELLRYLADPG